MTSQADDSMPSLAYRRLMGLVDPDNQRETISSAEYRERFGQTANDLLRGLDAKKPARDDQEPRCKTDFADWLDGVSPFRVQREFRFIEGREFRGDFVIPKLKLCFEYDGMNGSAHGSIAGIIRDSEKINLGQIAGWLVIRVNALSLRNGTGYQMAMDAFRVRGVEI